jgi:hypothetical protein
MCAENFLGIDQSTIHQEFLDELELSVRLCAWWRLAPTIAFQLLRMCCT